MMGCNIHAWGEKQLPTTEWVPVKLEPQIFDWRSYSLFGFLADVRNYSNVTPIAPPRGLPEALSKEVKDASDDWDSDGHAHSYLTLAELEAFNYDQPMEDRRYMAQTGPNSWNGAAMAEPGQGKQTTYREFLGPKYFKELERLKAAGVERMTFWFDN